VSFGYGELVVYVTVDVFGALLPSVTVTTTFTVHFDTVFRLAGCVYVRT
jgi:hypothetical protein